MTAPAIVPEEFVAALPLFILTLGMVVVVVVVLVVAPIDSEPVGHPSAEEAFVPLATVSKTPPPTHNPVTSSTARGAHEHEGVLQTDVTPPRAYHEGAYVRTEGAYVRSNKYE